MRRLLAAIVLACLLGSAAQAQRLPSILQAGVLRVGMTGDYRPFSIVDSTAADGMSGLDVDMAQSLAQSLGVKLQVVKTSWSTLMPDLLADKYDIAMGGITITLPRARTAFFSAPVMMAGKTPIARCADMGRFPDLAAIDRPGVRVIVNPGGTNESFDRANLHQADIVPWPDNATIFDQLAAGRADLMITDGVETLLQAKLHPGVLCPVHPDAPFTRSELAYMLPQDAAWLQYVNAWLHIADESGAHRALLQKYLN